MQNFIYNPPLEPYLDFLYEDDDFVVVNKPSGLLSVPGRLAQYHDSVLSRVRETFPEFSNIFAVHRLDLGTSGVLAVALNTKAASELGKQFMQRKVKKIYIAYVYGILDKEGSVDLPLRTDIDNRPYQIVDFEQGKKAYTEYEPLFIDEEHNRTLVRLFPRTGRSHQLRVHMKEIGHPILGDHLYAHKEAFEATDYLHLHAACLELAHPRTQKTMRFICKPKFALPDGIEIKESWLKLCKADIA